MSIDNATLRARMSPELPAGLVAHTDRVVALAEELARAHGLDLPRTRLMAQAHDLLRAVPPEELLARAEAREGRGECEIDAVERVEPVLLHGPLGALELAERFGLDDPAVLHAVRWHTTGHPHYTSEAWAMFVADKAEPHKLARWPALEPVLDAARESLEAAALAYLDLRLVEAVEQAWLVHPMATRTRNALVQRLA